MDKSIMLIDDDQLFNFLNRRIVEKLQVFNQVEVFNNAKMALEQIKTQQFVPQYILLDLRMPVMNGFEFLDELEKLPESIVAHTEVIVLTSSLMEEDREQCLQYKRVVAFLPKPLDATKLIDCLK